jgi:SnoaL-like protein
MTHLARLNLITSTRRLAGLRDVTIARIFSVSFPLDPGAIMSISITHETGRLRVFGDRGSPAQAALDVERRQAMSYSISTLLTRNLHDVFGENDPARRRAAIDEVFTEDCVFYDPSKGVYRGRDEIDRVAGAIRATHPDFRYQPIAEPEELGNAGRIQWVSGRPGEAPAYAGTDFIIARDGRIAALYLFFDKLR